MSQSLFSQNIDTALTKAQGVEHWHAQLPMAWAALQEKHQPEIDAIIGLPGRSDDLAQIEAVASEIAENFKALVIVGMGGSSLGAETLAALRSAGPTLHVLDNVDPVTFAQVCETLPWHDTAFLIVSKSGTTVEVHGLFSALLAEAKKRSLNIAKQFICITICNGNVLHQFAQAQGMRVLDHDAALCGRFSIFSAVGLLPAAAIGVDVRAVRAGASVVLAENRGENGPAAKAAALNMALMDQGTATHVLMHYTDALGDLARWVRQCWAESLGKDGLGTLMVRCRGATDQHSQLQLYLEGPKDKYFTALMMNTAGQGAAIANVCNDAAYDCLKGNHLGDLLFAEQRATNDSLVEEGCPLRTITLSRLDAAVMGGLLMHFTLEVMYTAALMGVNPFNQPAVEAGKKRTLAYLAGK